MIDLIDYGMAGLFISYLIYDRQTIIKKLISSVDNNTAVLNKLLRKKK